MIASNVAKRIATLLLVISLLAVNSSALTLIDNITETESEFESSPSSVIPGEYSYYDGIKHNFGTLSVMEDDNSLSKDNESPGIDIVYGYHLSPEHKYLVSANFIHVFSLDDKYSGSMRYQSTGEMVSITGGYLSKLESEVKLYKASGFPGLPDFHYSLLDDDDYYVSQKALGLKYGCVPTSLAMAIGISEGKPYEYRPLLDAMKEQGLDLRKEGTSLLNGLWTLGELGKIDNYAFSTQYNPYAIIDRLLDGHPIVILIDNNVFPSRNTRFMQICGAPNGSHAITICGFFLYGDKIGFQIYDPDGDSHTLDGKGCFIWDRDLEKLTRFKGFIWCEMKISESDDSTG